jgi:hypothetical protein
MSFDGNLLHGADISHIRYYDLLKAEVEKIQDEQVLAFTQLALAAADRGFWYCPCSSTGKHHPPENNGIGGLLRHIIKACTVGEEFARMHNFTQYELDLARSAVLLHDIKKHGEPWGEKTDYRHGLIGARWLEQFPLMDRTGKQIILEAVRYHMGQWVTTLAEDEALGPENMEREMREKLRARDPHSIIELCVQRADYWASRPNMSFLPDKQLDEF